MKEDLAYYLAQQWAEFHGEELDERDFKVSIMYWLNQAQSAIDFIEEYNATH